MTDNPMLHRVHNRITAFCYAHTILIVAGLIVTGSGLTGIAYPKEFATAGNGVVCVRWVHDFKTTIDLLKSDIAEKGIMFFDEIDQSGIGAKTGIQLRPSTLLIFGNPPLGIQFLTSNPYSGLDWPVRRLVTEDEQQSGLGGLYGFLLDRAAPSHHQPRRGLQNGERGDRVRCVQGREMVLAAGIAGDGICYCDSRSCWAPRSCPEHSTSRASTSQNRPLMQGPRR